MLRHNLLFFFNDTATTEIYTLSLHDALPISLQPPSRSTPPRWPRGRCRGRAPAERPGCARPKTTPTPRRRAPEYLRSEEHTSELQSRQYLVCRLLLEKKKKTIQPYLRTDLVV